MKKYILVILLLLTSLNSNKLFAEGEVDGHKIDRYITAEEFNGNSQIQLGLNEKLIISDDTLFSYSNNPITIRQGIHITSSEESILHVDQASSLSNCANGIIVTTQLLCTPVSLGQATVTIAYANGTLKKLLINIIEATSDDLG